MVLIFHEGLTPREPGGAERERLVICATDSAIFDVYIHSHARALFLAHKLLTSLRTRKSAAPRFGKSVTNP